MKRTSRRCPLVALTSLGSAMLFFAPAAFGQGSSSLVHEIPSGSKAAAAAAEAEQEAKEPDSGSVKKRKERFTYGKLRGQEAVESKESTNAIQKNKGDSGDATVPTGVFKDSLLDVDLSRQHNVSKPTPTPVERVNPLRRARIDSQPAAGALPSASPETAAAAALTAPSRLDITLGVSPAPTPTPRPQSQ
jgi:hypothetical protein